jgi:hypothetical protein
MEKNLNDTEAIAKFKERSLNFAIASVSFRFFSMVSNYPLTV